jgi:hypothetical protein
MAFYHIVEKSCTHQPMLGYLPNHHEIENLIEMIEIGFARAFRRWLRFQAEQRP